MQRFRRLKRVSWPPDVKLCQVRLFLSEDSPSQVGSGTQDHLQAKTPYPPHPSDSNLPPGFGGSQFSNLAQFQLSEIPVVKWECPARFLLNLDWRVVAGEESKELVEQSQRDMTLLEAFYPATSLIPPNPAVSVDIENSLYNDQQTPLIPITTSEDEDTPVDNLPTAPLAVESNENTPSGLVPDVEPLIKAAASLDNVDSNMVDHNLLIKILSDPKWVQNLVTNCGTGVSDAAEPALTDRPSTHDINGHFHPRPSGTYVPPPEFPQSDLGFSQVKDADYYKRLIQQHGEERQEQPVPKFGNTTRPRAPKPKIAKPCMFFNSSRGCRNGENCAYRHDASFQLRNPNARRDVSEGQNAKRMKFSGES